MLHISAIWNRSYRVLVTLAICYLVSTSIGLAGRISAFQTLTGKRNLDLSTIYDFDCLWLDGIHKFNPTNSCVVTGKDVRIIVSWAAGVSLITSPISYFIYESCQSLFDLVAIICNITNAVFYQHRTNTSYLKSLRLYGIGYFIVCF